MTAPLIIISVENKLSKQLLRWPGWFHCLLLCWRQYFFVWADAQYLFVWAGAQYFLHVGWCTIFVCVSVSLSLHFLLAQVVLVFTLALVSRADLVIAFMFSLSVQVVLPHHRLAPSHYCPTTVLSHQPPSCLTTVLPHHRLTPPPSCPTTVLPHRPSCLIITCNEIIKVVKCLASSLHDIN